jgi:3-hydroxyacyl-[acyl-carrier-protein] dehydratase
MKEVFAMLYHFRQHRLLRKRSLKLSFYFYRMTEQNLHTVLISKEYITEFIPQKSPIVMVDELLHCDDKKTVSQFTVDPENIFVKDGFLREPGIIENMAQTGALKAGYESVKQGIEPLVGFIGAIKDLKIYSLPVTGAVLRTEIFITNEVFNITIIKARSFCNELLIAECEMKIAVQKNIKING